MARLTILSSDDFNKLYKLPSLGDNDRPFVFELDEEDKAYLGSFNDVPKKIDYILQVNFFRITQFFYKFTFQGIRQDTWYVIKTFFPTEKFPKKQVSKRYNYCKAGHNQHLEALYQQIKMVADETIATIKRWLFMQ